MGERANPVELVGLEPDERLLAGDMQQLPETERKPLPAPRGRRLVVAAGVTLTGLTLIAGLVLVGFGVVDGIASGFGVRDALAIAVGGLLAATHWGWIHVAEAIVTARRRGARSLLAGVEPRTRWSITTRVLDDGSIAIARIRHEPVRVSERTFSFASAVEEEQVHSGDEPAALVSERTEAARRLAALDTEREHERYRVAADAYESALLDRDDEHERLAARRAAARALSDQLNEKLRDPPLIE